MKMPADKPSSTVSEYRKSTKPLMEKRRRERINRSLDELKNLILEATNRNGARNHKLEKADILEMTVKHLKGLQKQRIAIGGAVTTDPSILTKYRAGYNECVNEIVRYLTSVQGVSPDVRARLLGHLANRIQGIDPASQLASAQSVPNQSAGLCNYSMPQFNPSVAAAAAAAAAAASFSVQIPSPNSSSTVRTVPILPKAEPLNPSVMMSHHHHPHHRSSQSPSSNGGNTQIFGGIQLIPTTLPNGQLAFVVPSNGNNNHHNSSNSASSNCSNSSHLSNTSSCSESESPGAPSTDPSALNGSPPLGMRDIRDMTDCGQSPEHLLKCENGDSISGFVSAVGLTGERVWRPW